MSVQAITWAYNQEIESSGAKFVLVTLANYADPTGYCYPSRDALARDTGQSVRAVTYHLAALAEAGVIRRDRRHSKHGHRDTNGYQLAGFKPGAESAHRNHVLSAESAAPKCSFQHSLGATSAAPYRSDPSLNRQGSGAASPLARTREAQALFDAFLDEVGADTSDVPKRWIDEQLGAARKLLADGCDEAEMRQMVRYAHSQTWRDGPITLITLQKLRGEWIFAGRPERWASKSNGAATSKVDPFAGLAAWGSAAQTREAGQ